MRNRIGLACALLACFMASTASAAVVLDQSFDGGMPITGYGGFLSKNSIDIAQTFTVGVEGELNRVEFSIGRSANTTAPLFVDIRVVDPSGVPQAANAPVLASATLDPSAVGVVSSTLVVSPLDTTKFSFVGVDLASAHLLVTPGQVLSINLRSDDTVGGYYWAFTAPDPYAGGHGYFRFRNAADQTFQKGGADQYFKTYVATVPVPSAAWAGMALLAGLAFASRVRAIRCRRLAAVRV